MVVTLRVHSPRSNRWRRYKHDAPAKVMQVSRRVLASGQHHQCPGANALRLACTAFKTGPLLSRTLFLLASSCWTSSNARSNFLRTLWSPGGQWAWLMLRACEYLVVKADIGRGGQSSAPPLRNEQAAVSCVNLLCEVERLSSTGELSGFENGNSVFQAVEVRSRCRLRAKFRE